MGRSSIKHDDDNPNCKCFTCFMGITKPNKPSVYEEFMAQSEDSENPAAEVFGFSFEFVPAAVQKIQKPLEVRVAKDIESLTAGITLEGKSTHKDGKELPKKETTFDASYVDAYEAAIKNCVHTNIQNLLYNKEWYCEDCGKHFNQAEIKKIMARRNPFGYFTGF
jgi:hypothetical protein